MLKSLDEEERFSNLEIHKFVKQVVGEHRRRPQIDETPLEDIDCTDADALLRNKNLEGDNRLALLAFLKKFKAWTWLQSVDDRELLARICLILAWGGELGVKTPLCGLGKWLCHDTSECPLCRHRYKGKPLVLDYAKVYGKAKFHYAVTPSFTCSPKLAGVHFVTSKREVNGEWEEETECYNPFADAPEGIGLRIEDDQDEGVNGPVAASFRACFEAMKAMVGHGIFDGAVVAHEIAWHFMRDGKFDPHVTPHGHGYVNSSHKLTFEHAVACYDTLVRACCQEWLTKWEVKRHPSVADAYQSLDVSQRVYPVLHIAPLEEAKEVRRWHYYLVKSHKFVAEYKRAIAAGVSKRDLNEFMRFQLFQGGTEIFAATNSPRRYGNLKFRAHKVDQYLGDAAIALGRKAARSEQRERREAARPQRRRPRGRSPVKIEMDKQTMEETEQALRDEQDARNAMNRGEQEDASSGHNPS